jgi:hypothetical protein
MRLFPSTFFKGALAVSLLTVTAAANASWMQVVDPDLSDLAFNPGGTDSTMAPTNQNADTVAAWIEDLVGFAAGSLILVDSGDLTPESLIIDATTKYVAVHYGNLGGNADPLGKATIAYYCASDCGTFTPETMAGISDYRVYRVGRPDEPVPAPAGFALLGAGLIALSQLRRRTTG